MFGPTLMCALANAVVASAPASPSEYHAAALAHALQQTLPNWTATASHQPMLEATPAPAAPSSGFSRWFEVPSGLSSVVAYHARVRPGATPLYWSARAVDFWLWLRDPGCQSLRHRLNARADAPVFDFRPIVEDPVEGPTSSPFGYRRHPISKRRKLHKGLDFNVSRGTPVRAAGAGRVLFAGRRGSYGNLVVISHGLGLETRYAHLDRVRTDEDRVVAAGQVIGTVGSTGRSTGAHLHFEVRHLGVALDPSWALGRSRPSLDDIERVVARWYARWSRR